MIKLPISAVVLAGGRSTRMGFDKQLLWHKGQSITDYLIGSLGKICTEVLISGGAPELYEKKNVRVLEDQYRNAGPLGGLHSGLAEAQEELVFLMACDMPYLELPYLKYMFERIKGTDYGACVTSRGEHLEIFHALYARRALPSLTSTLQSGAYSFQKWVRQLNALCLGEQEALDLMGDWRAFTNLNTPEDYGEFIRRVRDQEALEDGLDILF